MSLKRLDIDQVREQYLSFAHKARTLLLATTDAEGYPFISYAPFVEYDGRLYVYLSRIAHHYNHLEERPLADVMLIEDEAHTENLFARQRARFRVSATNIGNEGNEEIFEQFDQRFGTNLMGMLRTLDFSLFMFTVQEGRYVAGFGQAFDLDFNGTRIEHVARDGHQSSQVQQKGEKANDI
jgi:putative heme iron utilization protein